MVAVFYSHRPSPMFAGVQPTDGQRIFHHKQDVLGRWRSKLSERIDHHRGEVKDLLIAISKKASEDNWPKLQSD